MFCPKCGNKLESEQTTCTNCGYDTVVLMEQEVMNSTDETENKNSETDVIETREDISVIETEEKPMLLVKKEQKSKNAVIAVITVFLAIIVAVIIGQSVYRNSDGYKTEKAVDLILEGNYDEAFNMLLNIYTPQADVIRNYIEVEEVKTNFINICNTENRKNTNEAYNEFHSIITYFDDNNEIYYLPEQLKNNYNCYKAAFDYITKFIHGGNDSYYSIYEAVYDIQSVMMNEIDRNNSSENGSTYTLNTLQERVNISKKGLDFSKKYEFPTVEINDANVSTYCRTSRTHPEGQSVIYISDFTNKVYKTLVSNCKSEISASQSIIDASVDKFNMDDNLYMIHPKDNYSSNVGIELKRITSYSEIVDNRNTVCNILSTDILYYLITGSTID